MFIIVFISMITSTMIWLVTIRPYAIKNGAGFTPGTNAGVTMWVDWQQASEIARGKDDAGMQRVCRVFLGMQLLMIGSLLIAIFGYT